MIVGSSLYAVPVMVLMRPVTFRMWEWYSWATAELLCDVHQQQQQQQDSPMAMAAAAVAQLALQVMPYDSI